MLRAVVTLSALYFYAYILVSYVTCYLQCHCCPVAQAQVQSPTVTVHILLHAPTLSVSVVFKAISIVIIVSDDH